MIERQFWTALRFRAIRRALGLSQAEAAHQIGITGGAWCLWENGRRQPKSRIVRLALRRMERRAEAAERLQPPG